MSKVVGTVVGVVVVAGIAWTGAAYYTGTKVEKELIASIDKANVELAKVMPVPGVKFALASFERGVFSSDARYTATLSLPAQEGKPAPAPIEVLVSDHIEHGPFPWSRLKTGKLAPMMATSNAKLEKNGTLDAWFVATKDVPPVSSTFSLGYGGSSTGVVRLAPAEYAEGDSKLTFSGLDINADVGKNGESVKVSGLIESIVATTLSKADGKPLALDFKGVSFDSDMTKGIADLYLGKYSMTTKSLTIAEAQDKPMIVLRDLVQRADLGVQNDKLNVMVGYEVGGVNYKGKDVGGGQFVMKGGNLDPAALKTLNDLYLDMYVRALKSMGSKGEEEMPEMTPEQAQALQGAMLALLAGNPTLSIDPLQIKTSKGESTFNLNLSLTKPSDKATSIDAMILETIKTLDAKLVVSKGMLAEIFTIAATQEGADPAQAAQMATMQSELVAGMGAQAGVVKVEGDKITSTLNYAAGQVDFNGKKMPVEEFAGEVFSMVLGYGSNMGLSGGDMDEEDEEEMEEAPADEAVPAEPATRVKP